MTKAKNFTVEFSEVRSAIRVVRAKNIVEAVKQIEDEYFIDGHYRNNTDFDSVQLKFHNPKIVREIEVKE